MTRTHVFGRGRARRIALVVAALAAALAGATASAATASAKTAPSPAAMMAYTGRAAASSVAPSYIIAVYTINARAPWWGSNGVFEGTLPPRTLVEVTCYYRGNPPSPWIGDGYQDHVVWIAGIGDVSGHIPDYYVNLGGDTPPQFGVPVC